jgi:transcriptional regulator with XRE-family HTH domain
VPKPPLAQFGARVRRYRKQRGLSQEKLGFEAGVHRTFVGAVERGEVNISIINVLRLARALGRDPSVLVRGLSA